MMAFVSRFINLPNAVALHNAMQSLAPSGVKRRVHGRFLDSETRATGEALGSYSAKQLSCLQTTKFGLTIRFNILRRYAYLLEFIMIHKLTYFRSSGNKSSFSCFSYLLLVFVNQRFVQLNSSLFLRNETYQIIFINQD